MLTFLYVLQVLLTYFLHVTLADLFSTRYTCWHRTGQRTRWGMLQDGWNSAIRYLKNNFSDGFRQDSLDLFLGEW